MGATREPGPTHGFAPGRPCVAAREGMNNSAAIATNRSRVSPKAIGSSTLFDVLQDHWRRSVVLDRKRPGVVVDDYLGRE